MLCACSPSTIEFIKVADASVTGTVYCVLNAHIDVFANLSTGKYKFAKFWGNKEISLNISTFD